MAFSSDLHAGDLRLVLGLVLVVILLRDDARGNQAGPALRGDAGQLEIGFALLFVGERLIERRLRLLQIGFGLDHLLVQFGRFDFGHGLAGLDAVSDVHQAAFDVAVGAGEDGGFGHGLDVAGELQFAHAGGAADFDHFHSRQRLFLLLRLAADYGVAFLQAECSRRKMPPR